MQISTQTYNAYVPAESSPPQSAFSDVRGARLLCWSAALFSISLRMASLFFDAQFKHWNAARNAQDRIADLQMSNPQWEKTLQRLATQKAARRVFLPHMFRAPDSRAIPSRWIGATP